MSARKETFKHSKQKDRETIKFLIQNVKNHWPDLTISEEHLQNPTTEFVKGFYSRFYSEYEKVTNNIRTNILEQEKKTDQNMYNEEISLSIKLKRICEPLEIPFKLNDMCEPQPKRTLTFFSVLMNVLIFLESNNEYINEVVECVEKKKYIEELKTNKSDLIQEIGDLNEMHVQLENNICDLNQNIQDLTKEHKHIMMLKAEKDFKYQQDIKSINKLKEDIAASNEHLKKLREKSSSLQEQIISENEVEELKNKIKSLEKEFDDLDIERSNIVASLKVQEEKTNFYNKCLASIENPVFFLQNLDCLKIHIEELATLNQQVNKVNETMNFKQTELKNLHVEYANLNENLQKTQKEFDDLNSECKEESVKMKNDLNTLILKIKKDEDSYRNYKNENSHIEETISSLKNDMDAVNRCCLAKYEQLMKNQEEVMERFHGALLNVKKTQSRNS